MTKIRGVFTVTVVLLFVGCAGNPSKDAALLLVDEIDNYQASVASKIKAEQTFYKDIRHAASESASLRAWIDQEIETLNRVTRMTDQAIVVDKGVQVSILQQFLRDEDRHARERRAVEDSRKAELEANYRTSFESLNLKQRELSAARSKLLGLTQDGDITAVLFERIREAAKKAKQLQEQAEAMDNDSGG